MAVAGILLTGGASSRMGSDKALLRSAERAETLAERTGRLLALVADPCIEVGPWRSGLPGVQEDPAGQGPLAALACGWAALRDPGGPAVVPQMVLVVATDLPALDARTLRWLAEYPEPGSAVPVVDGRPQPLCARWSSEDLDQAVTLVAHGRRALRDLIAAAGPRLIDPAGGLGPGRAPFADADTPATARALGLLLP